MHKKRSDGFGYCGELPAKSDKNEKQKAESDCNLPGELVAVFIQNKSEVFLTAFSIDTVFSILPINSYAIFIASFSPLGFSFSFSALSKSLIRPKR